MVTFIYGYPQNLTKRRKRNVHNRTEGRNDADLIGTDRCDIEKAESGDQTAVFHERICKEFDNFRFV